MAGLGGHESITPRPRRRSSESLGLILDASIAANNYESITPPTGARQPCECTASSVTPRARRQLAPLQRYAGAFKKASAA